ncbi:MAG: tRNA (guanosine(37)-N1)-methyltransferase TrmD, partial [Planctomycetes bacterium]|nr:tRNA (guanosine(37)-N1)-methyltransferase TrmD [Planctomycetota bacterium]
IEREWGPHRKLALCPSGATFSQPMAQSFVEEPRLLLLCGRYEGFDERIFELHQIERVSIGNFVLSGGELPALCIVDAVTRLVPGALGDERSAQEDSFQDGETLDHPHYTRPRTFRGLAVPEVLMGGDHAQIDAWRRKQAQARTQARPTPGSHPTQPNNGAF